MEVRLLEQVSVIDDRFAPPLSGERLGLIAVLCLKMVEIIIVCETVQR